VKVQGYDAWISVAGPYRPHDTVVFLHSDKLPFVSVIQKDNWRYFRIANAEAWGHPVGMLIALGMPGIIIFLIGRCLTTIVRLAIFHARVGSKKIRDPDRAAHIAAFTLLGGRVLLILGLGLMVFLIVAVSVRTAIAIEHREIITGLIYFVSLLVIGSPAIPKLSQWVVDFVQGQIHRKFRELLVSAIFLFAVFQLTGALGKLLFEDPTKWSAWEDVIKAFWNALLS
jgi:hypothetical protein